MDTSAESRPVPSQTRLTFLREQLVFKLMMLFLSNVLSWMFEGL